MKKVILTVLFVCLIVSSAMGRSSRPSGPTKAQIDEWWKPQNRECPTEKLQVNDLMGVSLSGGEEAFLASVFFLDRGRNAFGGSLLVRPKLKEAREVEEIGKHFETIGLLDGSSGPSLISTEVVASGQGTTGGQMSIVMLDGWKAIVLHKRDFGDNLGGCGSIFHRRCRSEETRWIFADLDRDGRTDLIEVVISQDGAEAKNLSWRTTTRAYLLKGGKYIPAPASNAIGWTKARRTKP